MSQIRQLFRRLKRSFVFTVLSVLTLGVGIGANTAIFSMIQGVLLKPLPFSDASELISLQHLAPGIADGGIGVSQANYFTYREEGRVFDDIALYNPVALTVTGLERPERVEGLRVTHRLLPLLRVLPHLGRAFTPEDDSTEGERTVLLGFGFWQQRFGSDPDVLGRRVQIDGLPWTVIGVLPEEFDFLNLRADVLVPYRFDRAQARMANFSYRGIGRLKPGVTLEAASDDVERMIPLGTEKFPRGLNLQRLREAGFAPFLRPLKALVVGSVGEVLWILLGTVGIVLLIACANVANLLMIRTEGRHRELGVRSALGAGHLQLAKEIVAEILFLALAGGVVGVALAETGLRLLRWIEPESLPRLAEISIDSRVLIFTLSVSLLTVVFFGALPLIRTLRLNLLLALGEGSRGVSQAGQRHRVRNALVVSQIALALTLLIASGLMVRSFQGLLNVEPGFQRPEEVLTMRIYVPEAEIPENQKVAGLHRRILESVVRLPGVESAGIVSTIPMANEGSYDDLLEVEGYSPPAGQMPPGRPFKWISPGYLESMEIPLIAGRTLDWRDVENAVPVVLVNQAFSDLYWAQPGQAVGKRIKESLDENWRDIVGVIGDVRDQGLAFEARPTVYWPLVVADMWGRERFIHRSLNYTIRARGATRDTLGPSVRDTVWSVNGNLAVANMTSLDDVMSGSRAQASFTLVMLAIAAGGALLLAVVGIYGVISFTVSQRTREIGIRVALGADQRRIRALVVGHGARLVSIGLFFGLGTSFLLMKGMTSLLFGVGTFDPLTYIMVTVTLATVALAASYAPAHRAARIDPIEALRSE